MEYLWWVINLPENRSDAMKFVEFSISVIFVIFPPHGGLQSFKKSGNRFISLIQKYCFRYFRPQLSKIWFNKLSLWVSSELKFKTYIKGKDTRHEYAFRNKPILIVVFLYRTPRHLNGLVLIKYKLWNYISVNMDSNSKELPWT